MKTKLAAVVGALMVALGLSTVPHVIAATGWVSAAWSNVEDHVHFRWGYATKADMDASAVSDCRITGGPACHVLASGTPCIAVLDDFEHAHWAVGASRDEAIANALMLVDPVSAHLTGVHCYWE
ncbi:DUF4189 domain-containing protein [Mycobacterium mantenii]|uniref:DUF4189 domain-containing protein n=1 Tax=Mycobacterium mantenii TaxID=560555 RepID=UPI0009EE65D6